MLVLPQSFRYTECLLGNIGCNGIYRIEVDLGRGVALQISYSQGLVRRWRSDKFRRVPTTSWQVQAVKDEILSKLGRAEAVCQRTIVFADGSQRNVSCLRQRWRWLSECCRFAVRLLRFFKYCNHSSAGKYVNVFLRGSSSALQLTLTLSHEALHHQVLSRMLHSPTIFHAFKTSLPIYCSGSISSSLCLALPYSQSRGTDLACTFHLHGSGSPNLQSYWSEKLVEVSARVNGPGLWLCPFSGTL